MKVGDLTRRLSSWVEHNPWMKAMMRCDEIGIITKTWVTSRNDKLVMVLWPRSGLRTEHINDLECVQDSSRPAGARGKDPLVATQKSLN